MKKKNILNLIKYHTEKNDKLFREESIEIAKYFDNHEDYQLAEYIMSMLSDTNTLVPQEIDEYNTYFRKVELTTESLPLPEIIAEDLKGIINAINHDIGINKFLFQGEPGTGKTETAKQIAKLLKRELYIVEFSQIIDSKLGQTSKNIIKFFDELNKMPYPEKFIILLDEIDIIAMDRINDSDVREMGRSTSTILNSLDNLNEKIILIATTNLYENFDKALTRRFDSIINFNRYSKEDLIEIAEIILNKYLKNFSIPAKRDIKIFRKIFKSSNELPYPGDMDNIIKTSLAFSSLTDQYDYLKRLSKEIIFNGGEINANILKEKGFSLREIEVLTGISKSKLSRDSIGDNNE